MRYKMLTVVASLFLFAGAAFAQFGPEAKQQEAKKDGWWIKADPQNQKAPMMAFYAGPTSGSYGFWRGWNPENPAEFDVPQDYRYGPTFYILAQTSSGQKCRLCLMYKDKGVKQLEFDLEADYEAKQSEEDPRCK
jgi:hypothetical protein